MHIGVIALLYDEFNFYCSVITKGWLCDDGRCVIAHLGSGSFVLWGMAGPFLDAVISLPTPAVATLSSMMDAAHIC